MQGMLGKRRAYGNTSTGMRDGDPETDIVPLNFIVRFTLKSRHQAVRLRCPLRAIGNI
jgi:hypothetical protein